MTRTEAIALLERFQKGTVTQEQVLRTFLVAPVTNLGFAQVDLHRGLRKGFPEVIFGAGKTPAQVVAIARQIWLHEGRVLVTRASPDHARMMKRAFRHAVYHQDARCVTLERNPLPKRVGTIAVLCAGTSDLAVAEEAAVTAEVMGNRVERVYDIGVAGLHRLLGNLESLQCARVIIAVAGMEGLCPVS